MEIGLANVLAGVERRIRAICSGPTMTGLPETHFGARVRQAMRTRATRTAIDDYVRRSAAAERIDPGLLAAIIACESGFDPNATSRAGARGLMQLMPQTAASLGVSDSYDPVQNVAAGARYLRSLIDRFGDVELAIAAYNAGPGAVERYRGVPPFLETRKYVRAVLAQVRKSASLR